MTLSALALVGMMGAGKSAVGALFARRAGRRFVDLDGVLAAREGMSIPEIFSRRGEAAFRAAEASALRECLAEGDGPVVALGGGAFIQPAVREALVRAAAKSVFLDVPLAVLLERLEAGGVEGRPLLARADWREHLARLLAERLPRYRQADRVLAVGPEETPEMTAERVLALMRESSVRRPPIPPSRP